MTKKSLILLFFTIIAYHSFAATHTVGLTTNLVDGDDLSAAPGDIIKLTEGQRDYLLFRNIHGSEGNPVTIINEGGQVVITADDYGYYGIKFQNCSFIKLTGSGNSTNQYGIQIAGVTYGTGVSVDNLSTNFEMERVEIGNIPIAGIYVKTDPTCDNGATRDQFTMYDIKIHDCYFHDIADEGMYIGSSKYTGQEVADCGTLLPHVIEGVEVYNNIVENTGWDGIQVSSATKDCSIHDNIIRNDSYKETTNQMSGILIGGGSNCDCYNNKIFDGKGDGIDVLGLGNHKIYNNLIVRPGMSYLPSAGPTNNQKHGIWVGNVLTDAGSEMFIYNNTIVSPKTHGIKLTNTAISSYKIYNNIICEPSSYSILGSSSYMNINILINYQQSNNYLTNLTSNVQFINAANDNYDLDGLSPAVNTGLNMSSLNLTFDIENRTRPFKDEFDIGAYESQDPTIGIFEGNLLSQKWINEYVIVPNPINTWTTLTYELNETLNIRLLLIDLQGKIVRIFFDQKQNKGSHTFDIQKNSLPSGIYFLKLESKYGTITKKVVFI